MFTNMGVTLVSEWGGHMFTNMGVTLVREWGGPMLTYMGIALVSEWGDPYLGVGSHVHKHGSLVSERVGGIMSTNMDITLASGLEDT